MTYTNKELLDKTIEIVKEYGRGGYGMSPNTLIDLVYKKLKELSENEK